MNSSKNKLNSEIIFIGIQMEAKSKKWVFVSVSLY